MKTILLWVIALLITIGSAIYQRTTGPTYPLKGEFHSKNEKIEYKLQRSHSGSTDEILEITTNQSNLQLILNWKRFKTQDEWTKIQMEYKNGKYVANLPGQPPAGKLEYFLENITEKSATKIPTEQNVVIRFKGEVPETVLIIHVFAMFFGMLLSNRTALEYFKNGKNVKKLTYWTVGFIFFGGFVMGPIMQKYAFGEFWTGFPYGFDLTDNKTLIAGIAWVITLWAFRKTRVPQKWAIFASVVTFIIFMIPHSLLGSELDYNKLDKEKSKQIIEKSIN
jgi:hypothetical protein